MADSVGIRGWLAIYLKGACMGAADTVPGVSGGTIALILGIYERLIAALTSVDPRAIEHVLDLHTPDGRAAAAAELQAMDAPFLFVLGAGVLSAAATVASAMNVAVLQYPVPTYAFFFGLIAASAVVLYRYVELGRPSRIAVAIVGATLAFVVTGATADGGAEPTTIVVFLAGSIAISAMVLPGVSGAFLLLVLGQYEYISGIPRSVFEATTATLHGGDPSALVAAFIPFGAFMAGAIVGVFSVAYAVRAALERYREATLVFLVSLMVGALRYPATTVADSVDVVTAPTAAIVAVSAIAGGALVLVLDRYTDDLEY